MRTHGIQRDRHSGMQTLLALLGACTILGAGCTEPNQYQPPPPPSVKVAKPLVRTVTDYLEETGTTEAVDRVEVRARVKGFLEKVQFEEGGDVKKGDVLYVIEQREYKAKADAAQAELDAMQVRLDRAEIEYKRQQKLFAEKATAEVKVVLAKAQRDAALAGVAASRAALDLAKLDLEYTTVRAPISGRIGKTLVKAGNLVGDTGATHLTTIIRYDPIYVNFSVNERALLEAISRHGSDRTGRKDRDKKALVLFLQRATDTRFPFEGRFDYADLTVDQSTGTFMVRGLFANPDRKIIPGLFVRVRMPIGVHKNSILVPEAAMAADQAGRFVLVVNSKNVVERRNITIGSKQGTLVVVKSGLKPNERVVVAGIQRARPGSKVVPEETTISGADSNTTSVQSSKPKRKSGTPPKKSSSVKTKTSKPSVGK